MRILDLSTDYAGRYATRLLADQGHEVILATLPPDHAAWDQIRAAGVASADLGALAPHLDRNKSRLTFDFTVAEGRARLDGLLADADCVVHSWIPPLADRFGLTPDALRAANPALTLLTITAYGWNAPSWPRATEKTLFAEGGAMLVCGEWPDTPGGSVPFAPNAPVVSTIGGTYGAMALLAASIAGRADFEHLDIALRDLLPVNLERVLTYYSYLGVAAYRGARRERPDQMAGTGDYKAKDGVFHVWSTRTATFENLATLIKRPDLVDEPGWINPRQRTMTSGQIDALIEEALSGITIAELEETARALRMPSGRVVEVEQIADRPQFDHRRAVSRNAGGAVEVEEAYRFAATPRSHSAPDHEAFSAEGSRPVADGATDPAALPLAGIRVLDLTQAYAGPSATRILAELGADVIKVEAVSRLDIYPRGIIPFANDVSGDWWERAGYYAERNLNKQGITLDLAAEEGRRLFAAMLDHADVVASNFTPRVMRGWGFAPDQLLAINPRLVVLSMSGFGADGPDSDRPALAGLIEASSGFTSILRRQDGQKPLDMGFSFGDMISGLQAATSVLLALERRGRSGRGDAIDFSCAEAPMAMIAPHIQHWGRTGRAPSVTGELVAGGEHRLIRAAGDDTPESWVMLFVDDGREDEAAAIVGPVERREHHDQSARGAAELVAALRSAGFAVAPLLDGERIFADPLFRQRHLFQLVDRPSIGPLPYSRAFPVLRDGHPLGADLRPPPLLGEHNRAVFGDLLGLSDEAVEGLIATGLIGDRPAGSLPRSLSVPLPLADLEALGRLRRIPQAAARLAARFGYAADGDAVPATGERKSA